jgi:hypothetical protein
MQVTGKENLARNEVSIIVRDVIFSAPELGILVG